MRPFWLPIAIGLLLVSAAVGFAVTWPGFEPTRIDVTGNAVVPRAQILQRAGVAPHVNMWLQNTRAMATRVEAIPYVAGTRVYRLPPSTVIVAVRERVPFALVQGVAATVLIDRDLRVLQLADGRALPEFVLPERDLALEPGRFLTDPKAVAMRDDYEAMIAAHVVPLKLEFERYNGLVATVRGGVRILLGDDADLAKKLALVDPILAQVVRKQQRVAAVDLRAPGTPVLVFK